ncbi:MAG: Cytochrome c oxidase caa3-type, assembly factor CtaG-related protein [Candidatus Acidoferrum typicum]|nr:Cytochrome c oxidase caa3-type, assembly factor CtaG-related protein [Candidatus Acidoferrum typicum]
MPTPIQNALENWSSPVPLALALILTAIVYMRGWLYLRSRSVNIIPAWRAGTFFGGLFLIWIALGSPLAAFDEELLTVHMVQHLLLMTIGPPLILVGAPVMPILHGLPQQFVQSILSPLLRWAPMQLIGRVLSQPVVCWLAAAAVLVGWHIPAAFTLGLQSEAWHVAEHACFLASGFLFWWPVVQPWPSLAARPRWSILLYLFLATLPCDILSGFLAFCDRVVYPIYLYAPRHVNLTALEDQECAGALMWTCVTIAYLIAAAILTTQLLATRSSHRDDLAQSDSSAAGASFLR